MTLGEKIQALRKSRSWSQEQLAEQIGLSKSALGSYETEDFKDISHYALYKMSR